MSDDESERWRWTSNTLGRSSDQANQMLQRVKSHHAKLLYEAKHGASTFGKDVKAANTITLQDAFSSVMGTLSISTQQCLSYYKGADPSDFDKHDRRFYAKYLEPRYIELPSQYLVDPRHRLISRSFSGKSECSTHRH